MTVGLALVLALAFALALVLALAMTLVLALAKLPPALSPARLAHRSSSVGNSCSWCLVWGQFPEQQTNAATDLEIGASLGFWLCAHVHLAIVRWRNWHWQLAIVHLEFCAFVHLCM